VLLPPPTGTSSRLLNAGFYSTISTSSVFVSIFLDKAGFLATCFETCSFFCAAKAYRLDLSNSDGFTVAAASSIFCFFCGMMFSILLFKTCSPSLAKKMPSDLSP
jgi:hypothetical protein